MQLSVSCLMSLLLTVPMVDLHKETSLGVGGDYEGMMEAFTDIQENGDSMMAGIW